MTTLLSWLSVDARGPSAIYVVTDSRITWGSGARRWDSGRKVFEARSADVFGYCGDVLFPSLILGQITDLIERKLLWDENCSATERHAVVLKCLKTSFGRRHNAPDHDFSVVHAARDGANLASAFHAWQTAYNAKNQTWADTKVDTSHQNRSKLLLALGSGRSALESEIDSWNRTPQGNTARALFSAFCDSLASAADPRSGGMPQLVSLDRISEGKVIGFVDGKQLYIHGLPVDFLPSLEKIEWVDDLFQRVSPATSELLSKAQRHARVPHPDPGGFLEFVRRTGIREK